MIDPASTPNSTLFNRSLQIGKFLVEEGLLSHGHLTVALYDQKQTGLPLDEVLSLHGWIEHSTFHKIVLRKYREQLDQILKARLQTGQIDPTGTLVINQPDTQQ